MRPAASLLLSMALRWVVAISTSSSLVDTVARLVDVCTRPAMSGLIARTPWCWLASNPAISDASASSRTCAGRGALSSVMRRPASNAPRSDWTWSSTTAIASIASCCASGWNHDGGGCLARDGVALAAAVDGGDGEGHAVHQGLQNAAEDAQGVAAAFINVDAGVAALQAGDLDAPRFAGRGGMTAPLFAARRC